MWLDHQVVPWLSSVYQHTTRARKMQQPRGPEDLRPVVRLSQSCVCAAVVTGTIYEDWSNVQISTSWYDQSALPPPHLYCRRATPWNSYKSLFQMSLGISAMYSRQQHRHPRNQPKWGNILCVHTYPESSLCAAPNHHHAVRVLFLHLHGSPLVFPHFVA